MAPIKRWSEEEYKKFALIYKNYPCLWNSNYTNQDDKEAALDKIVIEVKNLFSIDEVTKDDINKKITNLRQRYCEDFKKNTESELFQILNRFLKGHIKVRQVSNCPGKSPAPKSEVEQKNDFVQSPRLKTEYITDAPSTSNDSTNRSKNVNVEDRLRSIEDELKSLRITVAYLEDKVNKKEPRK